jgi:hypothetical protein
VANNISRTQENLASAQAIYAALDLVQADIDNYSANFNGLTPDRATFTTLNPQRWRTTATGVVEDVVYDVQPSGAQSFTLYRQTHVRPTSPAPLRLPLLSAKEITLEYMNDKAEFIPLWPADEQRAPVAVRIRITDHHGHVWQRTLPFMVRRLARI